MAPGRPAGPAASSALCLLALAGVGRASELDALPPSAPPSPAPSPPAPPANTTVSFFNVGACTELPSVKFSFEDEERSGSEGELSCPPSFLVQGTTTCDVPGPYGREVFVNLKGVVEYLDISILNPTEDDKVLLPPTRVYLSRQKRNHVGVAVLPGHGGAGCATALHIVDDGAAGQIAEGYFRSVFRHAALGTGASATLVANGDTTIATLTPGQSLPIDQRLVTPASLLAG